MEERGWPEPKMVSRLLVLHGGVARRVPHLCKLDF